MSEDHHLTVDESCIYTPPSKLQVPDAFISNSDSAMSAPDDSDDNDDDDDDDDDDSSSASSSPRYAKEPPRPGQVRTVMLFFP